MGRMKDILITVYGGGDEAVAAVQRMGEDWRAMLEQAATEVEDTRLTPDEREAIEIAIECVGSASQVEHHATTLRRLLKRVAK